MDVAEELDGLKQDVAPEAVLDAWKRRERSNLDYPLRRHSRSAPSQPVVAAVTSPDLFTFRVRLESHHVADLGEQR
jgi:hypothetical protein